MTLPNLISLARLLAVPVLIWLLIGGRHGAAFALFAVAAISDAVDGFIAKRFKQSSTLGRYLDPLADKALLVSIYWTLGFQGLLPSWLVILVISRDVLIVGAVLLSFTLEQPVRIHPLVVSKVNTVAQACLAGFVLAGLGMALPAWQDDVLSLLLVLVAATTALSGASYLVTWIRFMNALGRTW